MKEVSERKGYLEKNQIRDLIFKFDITFSKEKLNL